MPVHHGASELKANPAGLRWGCVPVLAEQVWDPLSSSQTARLVGFIRRLTRSYPTVLHGDNRYTEVLHTQPPTQLQGPEWSVGTVFVWRGLV